MSSLFVMLLVATDICSFLFTNHYSIRILWLIMCFPPQIGTKKMIQLREQELVSFLEGL